MNANLALINNQDAQEGTSPKRQFSRNKVRFSIVPPKDKKKSDLQNDYECSLNKRSFDIFHNKDNDEARGLLTFFNEIINENLENLQAVYLENFGFLVPRKEQVITYSEKNNIILAQNKEVLTVTFEKCLMLNSYFKEKYNLKELRDILKDLSKEDLAIFKDFELRDLLKYETNFVNTLKNEVINNGKSELLSAGTLFAIHNRQGDSFHDWYAGTQIVFKQKIEISYKSDRIYSYQKPIYEDALEVFKTAYGEPVGMLAVNLRRELIMLGFSIEDVREIKESALPLYIFEDRSLSEQGFITLYYITNSLRKYGINEYGIGTEFVFAIRVNENDFRNKDKSLNIPAYPARAFVAAWLMLQRDELRNEHGAFAVKYNKPLITCDGKILDAICISDFEKLNTIQLAQDGKFFYKNILGITIDELVFANRFSAEYILDLLKEKNLHQITRVNRRSIVEKTERLV